MVRPHSSSNTWTTSSSSSSPVDTRRRGRAQRYRPRRPVSASARYSSGDWQSTVTPRRCIRSSRSAGSNTPSCRTTDAPRAQGPSSVLQSVCGECAGLVHETTSPSPASSQCSAWTRAAKSTRACAVRRVGRSSVRSSRRRRRRRARPCRASAPRSEVAVPRRAPRRARARLRTRAARQLGSARLDATATLAPEAARRMSRAEAVSRSVEGTVTAPILSAPSMTSTQSGLAPATTSTRSPARTPASRSIVAQWPPPARAGRTSSAR